MAIEQIELTEPETVALVRLSNRRTLPLAFGPGWAAIEFDSDAIPLPWYVKALAELRGVEE